MKKLLIYLRDYKKESVLGPLFKLLEASFELIVPLVVASMIDVGISGNDKGYIIRMCLIMAALGLLESMLGFDETLAGLMIATYIAMDSFGTATNVTGDGAVAVIVDAIDRRR